MDTTAGNLVNFTNKPVIIQDGLHRYMGEVISVTEREDGLLDVALHYEDPNGHILTVAEIEKDWPVHVIDEEEK